MIYRVFIVVVFIAIIVGSVMLGGQQREAVSPTTVDERAGDLGYAARHAQLIETGADGHPLYTIDADLISEPPGTVNVQLQQVRMGFRDKSGNTWTGRADNGVVAQDTGKVELAGDVHVSGVLPGSKDRANITTDRLFVDTHAQLVTTDRPVTLALSGREIKATGLSADLNDRVVHLESDVHGTYSP
jgi:LPS export ABC transporter protein LptC